VERVQIQVSVQSVRLLVHLHLAVAVGVTAKMALLVLLAQQIVTRQDHRKIMAAAVAAVAVTQHLEALGAQVGEVRAETSAFLALVARLIRVAVAEARELLVSAAQPAAAPVDQVLLLCDFQQRISKHKTRRVNEIHNQTCRRQQSVRRPNIRNHPSIHG
jgi:hypothetical protein